MNKLLSSLILLLLIACNEKNNKSIGSIERIDPALDSIIAKDALPEIIAEGMEWSEGPLWIESEKMLLSRMCPAMLYINGQKRMAKKYTSRHLVIPTLQSVVAKWDRMVYYLIKMASWCYASMATGWWPG
jgi:hypothetical protein